VARPALPLVPTVPSAELASSWLQALLGQR
jgi:hypothetical protein